MYVNSDELKHKKDDLRGTMDERCAAWRVIMPYDVTVKEYLGWPQFNELKPRVERAFQMCMRSAPYTRWPNLHEAIWNSVLGQQHNHNEDLSMITPFITWRVPKEGDPRGTYQEREEARKALNAFDEAMQRQDPNFAVNKRLIVAQLRPVIRITPFTRWVEVVTKAWARVLEGKSAVDNTTVIHGGYFGSAPTITHSGSGAQLQNLPRLQGLRASTIIIDDPCNQETDVKTKGTKIKAHKVPKKDYNTVGVRFLRGHNLHKVYTYKVAKKAKLRLGEEIVVPTMLEGQLSNNIAVVVELHSKPQDTEFGIEYRNVFGRIAAL